ncbi:IS200/IS605 family transposase [Stieleria varia]|uniref:Transposase IS200 like protein n=1 Tax=Stieleria varia TaxID=2528005 RepID=A0A5C6AQE0_9BACT|nr:IS200/IS605 family transposase [Stieleria varia]TWU01202.1 Transposase IS200 like protein [Stieleria varia]
MSTYHSIHFHIVFSTKHRKPWIEEEWIEDFHSYIGGTIKGLGAIPLKVGGVADHVHLLVGCKTTHRPCDLVREIKKAATAWVHSEIGFMPFVWQDGYAIFSVSPDACSTVSRYIENQKEHHRKMTFLEELVEILKLAGIEFDPQYLE